MALAAVTPAEPEAEVLCLDRAAFSAFYRGALPHVYGYLLHRCGGNVAVAEDLSQEVFFAVVKDLRKGRRIDASLPWLLGIARHKLIDHFRRQVRSDHFFALGDDAVLADLALDTSAADARERAIAALGSLPASHRAVLVLRYLEGFSVPEIADALNRSIEAIESLLARGRVSFKRAYLEVSDEHR
jgi:RNA polymerase sigma-70 factor (ECF subfamily)